MYNDYKIVKQVARRPKPASGFLRGIMIVFAVILILLGIALDRSFMLPGFLLVVLYYVYSTFSQRDYEYVLENSQLTIDIIHGKKYRKNAHILDMAELEVLAPNWHGAVAKYRRNGGSIKLPKYDYTSYDPDTPFYTMIITQNREKIKLLLDLDESMLQALKKKYPEKVFLS